MGSGWAVAVTVVGGAGIVALLGLLGRYLGVWTWALAWVRAAREEKVHLCRTERTTSTRSYLFDSDLDWIGLWPRTGSYKRFTNLDDLPSAPSMEESLRHPDEPDLPPQPLRPAPAPPPRLPGWTDSGGEGSASPASSVGGFGAGVETPPEPSRPAPVLDRRDSNRSLTGRLSRRDSSKELLAASQQSSPKRASTNPFRASWVPPDEASEAPLAQNAMAEPFKAVSNTEGMTLLKGPDYPSPPSYGATTSGVPAPSACTAAFTAPASTAVFTSSASTTSFHASSSTTAFTASANTAVCTAPASTTVFTAPASTAAFTASPNTMSFHASSNTAAFIAPASTSAFTAPASTAAFIAPANTAAFMASASTASFMTPASSAVFTAPASTAAFTASTSTAAFTAPEDTVAFFTQASTAAFTAPASTISFHASSGAAFSSSTAAPLPFSNATLSFSSPTTTTLPPASATQTAVVGSSVSPPFSGNLMDLESPTKPEEGEGTGVPVPVVNGQREGGERPGEGEAKEAGGEGVKAAQDSCSPQQTYTTLASQANGDLDNSDRVNSVARNISQDITNRNADTNVTKSYVLQNYNSPSGTNEVFARGPSSAVFNYDKLSTGVSSVAHRLSTSRTGETPSPQVSTDLSSRDSLGSPEFGRSYEVPATPPNTATYPYSPHSPHISSRLAEVEARMKQLGATMEQPRDTSQDWWPTETTSFRSGQTLQGSRESGNNPLSGSVDSSGGERQLGGLGRVEEEVTTSSSKQNETGRSVLGDEMEEEDESTRRVREYIASLSARLRQLPDEEDLFRGPLDHLGTPPTSANLPITPPNSATKSFSQGSTETPPSSAGPFSAFSSNRATVSSTPPSSAGLRGSFTSRRASMETSSPMSPGYGISRRLSLDTPPSSAGLATATPPNSAASLATFADTPPSSAGYSSTPPNPAELTGSFDAGMAGPGPTPTLKRAMSCDSVSSDTSVTLGELEDTCGQVTGQLTIQLIYDRDTADLEVVVVEGRELVGPDPHAAVDSYVRVFLLPDKSTNMQTRVCRRTNNPTYRERFLFALEEEELAQRCLAFYMYASDKFTNTLIGEAQLRLTDLDLTTPLSTHLTLTDTGQRGVGYGEIMFSLSYLPTAERLTVVVVKARSLQWTSEKTTADPFVKVYVLQNGKKVMKKKTSVKKDTRSPVFNEAMIFSVPAPALHNIQLRVTVAEHSSDGGQARAVGHVIVGTQATGKALSHWNQMMSALRKPIGMWHPLRR